MIAPNSYAQRRLQVTTAPTVVWSSIVRRGKSFGACIKAVRTALTLPGIPIALCRLERASMDESSFVSMRKLLGMELYNLLWKESKSSFVFPPVRCDDGETRQSSIACFGLVDPGRKLSTEYAIFVVDQAEQIEREHLALMQTRLNFTDPWIERRAAELGLALRQMILICNADDPEHWLNLDFEIETKGAREEKDPKSGKLRYEVILSQESDNAENLTEDWHERMRTELPEGTVWGDRLLHGRWVRAEGLVYGRHFNPLWNVIDRPKSWEKWGGNPPPDWPRYRALDWGVRDPCVVHWFTGIGSGSREQLICYREGYRTDFAPSDWRDWILEQEHLELQALRGGVEGQQEAQQYRAYLHGLQVQESWSDHDLAWRSELAKPSAKWSGKSVWTRKAVKDLEGGIPTMQGWLARRRLLYVRGMQAHDPDPRLVREKFPTTVLQEFGRYRNRKAPDNSTDSSGKRFDLPVDRHNHACDTDRYMIVSHTNQPRADAIAIVSGSYGYDDEDDDA